MCITLLVYNHMKKLLKIVERFTNWNSHKNLERFLTNFYIKKYGSEDKAKAVFDQLTHNLTNEKDKQKAIEKKLYEDLHIKQWLYFKELFEIKSILSLVKIILGIKSKINEDWSLTEKQKFGNTLKNLMIPSYEKTYNINTQKNAIKREITKAKLFTLAITRRELGYPDQRYFNRWLKAFFGDKYLNKGQSNGYLTLEEYLEIISAFLLTENETYADGITTLDRT